MGCASSRTLCPPYRSRTRCSSMRALVACVVNGKPSRHCCRRDSSFVRALLSSRTATVAADCCMRCRPVAQCVLRACSANSRSHSRTTSSRSCSSNEVLVVFGCVRFAPPSAFVSLLIGAPLLPSVRCCLKFSEGPCLRGCASLRCACAPPIGLGLPGVSGIVSGRLCSRARMASVLPLTMSWAARSVSGLLFWGPLQAVCACGFGGFC